MIRNKIVLLFLLLCLHLLAGAQTPAPVKMVIAGPLYAGEPLFLW